MKRQLSVAEAVTAASIILELNTKEADVQALLERTSLPKISPVTGRPFFLEWYAFAHAAVLFGLMAHAPNVVVVEYLRTTQAKLEALGLQEDETSAFVDTAFSAYVEPLVKNEPGECPGVFFHNYLGIPLEEGAPEEAAVVSGTMAMVLAANLDALEQYEYLLD